MPIFEEYGAFKERCQTVFASLVKRDLHKKGSKFFPFREDPFSKGSQCAGIQTGSHKHCVPFKITVDSCYLEVQGLSEII